MPPSYRDLEERLCRRGLDDREEIARRLAVSAWEIRRYHRYQYVIVNDDARRASHALASIILARRHRTERMNDPVEHILVDFETAAGAAADAAISREARRAGVNRGRSFVAIFECLAFRTAR